jgi:hypothetical protein
MAASLLSRREGRHDRPNNDWEAAPTGAVLQPLRQRLIGSRFCPTTRFTRAAFGQLSESWVNLRYSRIESSETERSSCKAGRPRRAPGVHRFYA